MEAVRPKKKHKKKPKDAASKTTEVHKHGTTAKPEEVDCSAVGGAQAAAVTPGEVEVVNESDKFAEIPRDSCEHEHTGETSTSDSSYYANAARDKTEPTSSDDTNTFLDVSASGTEGVISTETDKIQTIVEETAENSEAGGKIGTAEDEIQSGGVPVVIEGTSEGVNFETEAVHSEESCTSQREADEDRRQLAQPQKLLDLESSFSPFFPEKEDPLESTSTPSAPPPTAENKLGEETSELVADSGEISVDRDICRTAVREDRSSESAVITPSAPLTTDAECVEEKSKTVINTREVAVKEDESLQPACTPSAPLTAEMEYVEEGSKTSTNTREITSEREDSTIKGAEPTKLYPALDSSIRTSAPTLYRYRESLQAFSDDHLKSFYYNPLLEQLEGFVEHFIKTSKQDNHEFYELVNIYFKGRNALAVVHREYEIVEKECDIKKDHLWTTKDFMISSQGKCKDNITVTYEHNYQQVELSHSVPGEIEGLLKTLRKALHETLALQTYSCQLARLHIDIYIHELLANSSLLSAVDPNAPVTGQCPTDVPPDVQAELQKLRDCISVLFMFIRQPIQDQEFVDIVNTWMGQLIAVLLRVASLTDLVFLQNHVMRCPPGFANQIANFIQFPMPQYHGDGHSVMNEEYYWNNPFIHHFLAMLAGILQPVREREDFLHKLFVGRTAAVRSISWTLVDEDGEEDEDPENSWMLLQESDLVAVFSQFPFDAMFKHLLKMDPAVPNDMLIESLYCVERSSSRDVMKLLAFASCLVRILGCAFQTYQRLRYRAFVKRVGRTIRQTVQFVLDHWSNYRTWRITTCEDSDITYPDFDAAEQQFTLQRLQVEADQFFLRAVQQIMAAHRLGAWQFLADMPFESISSATVWKLFWVLHLKDHIQGSEEVLTSPSDKGVEDYKARIEDQRGEFTDQLVHMSQSEAVFLLTTFANMAISREDREKEFIEAVTLEVYEVAFVVDQTREFCSKMGRDLLAAIASVHPFVVSVLLWKIKNTINTVGKSCVYLCSGLPVNLWHPTTVDMDSIRCWLLKSDLSSPEHQLARCLLSNLNWGYATQRPRAGDELFLERAWHRALALMLVEVSAVRLPDRPGGIAHEAFKQDSGLLQQVVSITSSYNRLTQPNYEQVLFDWLWEAVLSLRLHASDLPVVTQQNAGSDGQHRGQEETELGFAGYAQLMSGTRSLDMYTEKSLTNLSHSVNAGGPLACYVAVAMTVTGADPDLFLTKGLDHVTVLLNEKCFDGILRLIANVVPMFFSRPERLLQESRFINVIRRLTQLDSENAGYAEKLLQIPTVGEHCKRLAGIIQSHVKDFQVPGTVGAVNVMEFWLKALCSLPLWYRDGCVQFLLDKLLMNAVKVRGALSLVNTVLTDAYKDVLKESESQGIIASFISFVSSGSGPPLLWDIKPSPDYSYYAYCVLCLEDQLEENSGLRLELVKQLTEDAHTEVDMALKKAAKKLKLTWFPPVSRLTIYRVAQQALATDMSHPILPLIWQRFFDLYLGKPVTQPGLSQRAGVGYRFFESQSNVSLLKKMKYRLHETAEHHRSIASQTGADQDAMLESDREVNKQFEETRSFHEKLIGFYQTFALWLDEPRLHDTSLYLPALPLPYDPRRLEIVLKGQKEPWIENVDMKKIDWELRESVAGWMKHAHGPHRRRADSKGESNERRLEPATGRIIRRMRTHISPQPPPAVVFPQAPLPAITEQMLANRQRLLNTVYGQLQILLVQARKFCGLVNHHTALDMDYIQCLPQMYKNEMSQIVVHVPCPNKYYKVSHRCSGPATLSLRFLAKHANEVILQKIADNRREHEQVVRSFLQPCPTEMCVAAAYVENAIVLLVNTSKSSDVRTREIAAGIGTSMFYQLAGAIDENVLSYQPTIQFFSSCVEILGKQFIMNNGEQTEQLLSAILEHTSITMLLVPYFTPNDSPELFTNMYQKIVRVEDKDLAFSLLTKFNLSQWLSSANSTLIERSGLTATVLEALCSCGFDYPEERRSTLEVCLKHFELVLTYNFPEQYSDCLRHICEGSVRRVLCLDVWNSFLSSIGCIPSQDGARPNSPQNLPVLDDEQVMETLHWLTRYFTNQRSELGPHVTGGLYTMWRPYIKQLSYLLGFMCQQAIMRTATKIFRNKSQETETAITELWQLICRVFEPWICSQDAPLAGHPPVAPWYESEVPQASDMITLFTDTLGCLQTHFDVPLSGSSLMNLFWNFFVTSLTKVGIPDYVLRVYHSKFFLLPWSGFYPTLPNMELMLELQGICKSSFRFLGCVFPLIDWSSVIQTYCDGHTAEGMSRFHALLFKLLIMLSNDTGTMEVQGSEMPSLLKKAQAFPWHFMDARSLEQAADWQIENADVCLILQQDSLVWFAIRLIRAAAGIKVSQDGAIQPTRPDTAVKRTSYVRCIVSLLCRCSKEVQKKAQDYPPVLEFVLKDIESVAGTGVDPANTASEVCMMMSEALSLLNNCAPVDELVTVSLNYFLSFIRDTQCTMLLLASIPAACRALANIRQMVCILEGAIESFFTSLSTPGAASFPADMAASGGWEQVVPGVSVPDLSQDEFVQECTNQSALLTLYTYVLLKLSTCESPAHEMTALTNMVTWCGRIKVRQECETKLPLLWHKILELALRQVNFSNAPLNDVARQLSFMAATLHQLGEDKDSSGLLGAIGFGRKSPLSVKFRFLCRSVEAFLLAQMPSNMLFRLQPKDPGYVREPNKEKQINASRRPVIATTEAEQAVSSLDSLRANKQYSSLRENILYAHTFITNPVHSLRDGPQFLTRLTRELFPGQAALGILG